MSSVLVRLDCTTTHRTLMLSVVRDSIAVDFTFDLREMLQWLAEQ